MALLTSAAALRGVGDASSLTHQRRRRSVAAAARSYTAPACAAKKVLIVNTPAGAHGASPPSVRRAPLVLTQRRQRAAPLGFYLAKQLAAAGHAVTILTGAQPAAAARSSEQVAPAARRWHSLLSLLLTAERTQPALLILTS